MVLKALGISTDKHLISMIIWDVNNQKMHKIMEKRKFEIFDVF